MSTADLIALFQPYRHLLSLQWWLEYIVDFYKREPAHLAVEVIAIAIILYLIFAPEYDPKKSDKLTPQVSSIQRLLIELYTHMGEALVQSTGVVCWDTVLGCSPGTDQCV